MSARIQLASLATGVVMLLAGCQDMMLRIKDPAEYARKVSRENADAALTGKQGHAKLLGDYIKVSGYNWVVLEGVALVVNLDGTGEDPPASPLRAMLLEDMRRRKVEDPQTLLRSLDTTMVGARLPSRHLRKAATLESTSCCPSIRLVSHSVMQSTTTGAAAGAFVTALASSIGSSIVDQPSPRSALCLAMRSAISSSRACAVAM